MIVLFDLDGTLIDSAPDIHRLANAALAAEGLAPLDLPVVRGFIGRGLPHLVDRLLAAHGATGPVRAARMVALIASRYEDAVDLTRLYPGVADALDRLASDGHTLGICTNKPAAAARAVLDHFGLLGRFATLIGGDSCAQRKPHPAPLIAAWRACGDGPAVYVGDSEIDAECAAAAGLPLILFTQGYRHAPAESLPNAALMDDFAALPALVASLARTT